MTVQAFSPYQTGVYHIAATFIMTDGDDLKEQEVLFIFNIFETTPCYKTKITANPIKN